MSKVCPNCQEVFDDNHAFCSSCGSRLVEMEKPAPTFNLGDANAISGGVNINQSKNITSHDVHYHTVQERNKTEKELLQERQNQYHDAVAQLLKGGVLTVEARAQLDKLKFNLGLDAATAANIETTVKNEQKTQARAVNDGLSVIGKMALKSAITAVEENNSQVQGCIGKLAPVCKTTMNEQVHFYYSMLMAACEPELCVQTYEKRTIDSYWLSYWASVAYRKLGNEMEAEGILTEMTGLWQERPEINVVINACLGIWLACKGNLTECQETIIEYLTQTEEAPSDELNDLFHALLHVVGVEEEDSPRYAFYNEHFLLAFNEEAELKKAQEAYDDKDYETALAIWNQLAERNNAEAFFNLGRCYYWGLGVPLDYYEAVKWYRKAAELGDGRASFCIGRSYDLGNGLDLDKVEAFNWFKKAAETGIVDAMVPLGMAYMCGNGTTENPQEAIKWWHKAADLGDSSACCNLGICYRSGNGVTADYVEAASWYRKAADMGNAQAMFNLGCCYMNGEGIIQDKNEAVKWWLKAADLDYADSFLALGDCYFYGDGITQDYAEAVKWYRKAADFGKSQAMYNLGACYDNGTGVTQNGAEAFKWYRKAAELGNVDCIGFLANCYETGEGGVSVDLAEALKWYRKAKELGNNTEADIQRIESKLNPTATTTHDCQRIPNLPKVVFEKAWVTQENDQTIGIHYSFNITNQRGQKVVFKCVTKSLTPGATYDPTNVIFVNQVTEIPNYDDTTWKDWKCLLTLNNIGNKLSVIKWNFVIDVQTELFVYDSNNNCLGNWWIRYKIRYENHVLHDDKIILEKN